LESKQTIKTKPFNVVDRFFNLFKPSTSVAHLETATAAQIKHIHTGSNAAGVVVNENTALTYSAVYACVRAISETIASLPLHVHTVKNDTILPDREHPVDYIISKEPNTQMTHFVFLDTLLAATLLWGNGYARIRTNDMARPTGLQYLHPSTVVPFIDEGTLYYAIINPEKPADQAEILQSYEILHIPALSTNGYSGISPVRAHMHSIGLGMAATEFGATFFGNGSNLAGVLEHPGKISDEAIDRLREQWHSKYGGVDNSHKTAVLADGIKYNRIGVPPNEAQFLETRQFQIEDIARIYNVPPHKIKHLHRSTYNNIEQQNIEFAQDTIRPWVKKIEEELDRKLFRTDERGKYFTRFNIDGLLRGDYKTRMEGHYRMFQMGAINPDEIRKLEGMPPRPDGKGDQYYVPVNMENTTTETNETNETPSNDE
jgi:HK97 family phage portal protein